MDEADVVRKVGVQRVYAVQVPPPLSLPTIRTIDFKSDGIDPAEVALLVDGLSGCMGSICVAFSLHQRGTEALYEATRAMLIHDNQTGYLYTRDAIDGFLRKHPSSNGHQVAVAYGFGALGRGGVDTAVSSRISGWFRERSVKVAVSLQVNFVCCLPLYHNLDAFNAYKEIMPVEKTSYENIARDVRSEQLPQRPKLKILLEKEWISNPATGRCQLCNTTTQWFHRHHCRNCGRFICDTCCTTSSNNDRNKVEKYCIECNPVHWS